jgi:hypothetical protein
LISSYTLQKYNPIVPGIVKVSPPINQIENTVVVNPAT